MKINNSRTESTCGAVQDDTSEHSDSSNTPIQATLVLFSHPDGVYFGFQLVSVPLKKLLKSKFLLGVNVLEQVLVCLVRGPANRPRVYPTSHPKSAGISSGSCDLAWISGD